jgi:Tfp pilus assembly protein PilV
VTEIDQPGSVFTTPEAYEPVTLAMLGSRLQQLQQDLAASQADLTRVERERDEATASAQVWQARFEAMAQSWAKRQEQRDMARAELATATAELERAIVLLGYAFHLRQHGERAPGGNETWNRFDRDAEAFLRLDNREKADG